MGRLTPEQRVLVSRFRKQGIAIKVIMNAFGISRVTIWYWSVQDLRTRFDIFRNYESKITIEAEASVLFFRSLGYGCARIQQRLFCAPDIELKQMEISVQDLKVSRQTINKILKKHKLNGYSRKNKKAWKFFRAKYPNELWQLDLKQFKFEGKKYYFVVLIDDYSRFLLRLYLFDHSPNIQEICEAIKSLVNKYHPKNILTDNNPFKDSWREWCIEQGINPLFAHPYYPQDKGKVERAIKNIAEELVNIICIFHKLLIEKEIDNWVRWFNEKRYHRGIKDYPANIYVKN